MADVLPLPETATDGSAHVETPIISRADSASPAPFQEPSLALDAIPQLDRSVSTASSSASTSSRLDAVDGASLPVNKRRGYMRPQPTTFADSARNRESVMSLGSIAHLQYYFARTGLLDGKGAQLARRRQTPSGSYEYSIPRSASGRAKDALSPISSPDALDFGADADALKARTPVDSPLEQDDEPSWTGESPVMLPPTVSTYNQRPAYVPPPPDAKTLRKELLQAVEDACKVLEELHKAKTPSAPGTPQRNRDPADAAPASPATPVGSGGGGAPPGDEERGMHQVQGVHLLDVTTLAIRAAKNYYTAHEKPQRLYGIKSERKIRTELYQVLEVLKKMAARNFAGGIRASEQNAILLWIVGISDLLKTEEDQERAEIEEREKWRWRVGDWTGKEREREWLFLKSLMPPGEEELPEWPAVDASQSAEPGAAASGADEAPTPSIATTTTPTTTAAHWRSPFLDRLRTGVLLVHAHNTAVRVSKRQFEEITKWHTDTTKPYRRAENVRYFVKAAERRWDVKLAVDVLSFVSDDRAEDVQRAAWLGFDAALVEWCRSVREEITRDWDQKERERDRAQAQAQMSPKTPS